MDEKKGCLFNPILSNSAIIKFRHFHISQASCADRSVLIWSFLSFEPFESGIFTERDDSTVFLCAYSLLNCWVQRKNGINKMNQLLQFYSRIWRFGGSLDKTIIITTCTTTATLQQLTNLQLSVTLWIRNYLLLTYLLKSGHSFSANFFTVTSAWFYILLMVIFTKLLIIFN